MANDIEAARLHLNKRLDKSRKANFQTAREQFRKDEARSPDLLPICGRFSIV